MHSEKSKKQKSLKVLNIRFFFLGCFAYPFAALFSFSCTLFLPREYYDNMQEELVCRRAHSPRPHTSWTGTTLGSRKFPQRTTRRKQLMLVKNCFYLHVHAHTTTNIYILYVWRSVCTRALQVIRTFTQHLSSWHLPRSHETFQL